LHIFDEKDPPGATPGERHAPHARVIGLGVNVVAYCPPQTEHDVVNTGADPLRYLFIVARAANGSPSQPACGTAGTGAPA
jgi:oxalate decarboxylase/phosphoglucose isomerase-like protein (cupin superfamily)